LRTRMGWAADDHPKITHSLKGKLKKHISPLGGTFFGDDAFSKHFLLDLQTPTVNDPEFVAFLAKKFEQEDINCPLIVIEPSEFNESERIQTAQMFEGYEKVSLVSGAVCEAKLCNLPTCLVIDLGEKGTTCTPVFEYTPIRSAVRRNSMGGESLTEYFIDLLKVHCQHYLDRSTWLRRLRTTREKFIQVKNTKSTNVDGNGPISIELPGGEEITCNQPLQYHLGEILFESSTDVESTVTDLVQSSLKELGSLQEILLRNIVVTGGAAKISGFSRRLEYELRLLYPQHKIQIRDQICADSSWYGAKKLAENEDSIHWLTKDHCPSDVNQICL